MILFHAIVVLTALAWVVWKLGFTPGGRMVLAWLYSNRRQFYKPVMVGIIVGLVWWSILILAWEAGVRQARIDRERREARTTEGKP